MRRFWQVEDDAVVGNSIEKLLAYIDTQILLGKLKKEEFPKDLAERGYTIAKRLLGVKATHRDTTEEEFIRREFRDASIEKLSLDPVVTAALKQRIEEIQRCLMAKASLAVIFLCGSTLEGILLGLACANPRVFNESTLSPKDKTGKVKQFHDWTLSDFIDAARDLNFVGEDVKKFSHALRDFRNYIHPYQQVSSRFNPDEHTAKICWQVLQAAITQISK